MAEKKEPLLLLDNSTMYVIGAGGLPLHQSHL